MNNHDVEAYRLMVALLVLGWDFAAFGSWTDEYVHGPDQPCQGCGRKDSDPVGAGCQECAADWPVHCG